MVCLLLKFMQTIQEKPTVNLYEENPVTPSAKGKLTFTLWKGGCFITEF